MSGAENLLPAGFEALEPFVDKWAISGTANRAQRRTDSTDAERVAFFEVTRDKVGPALDYLDKKSLKDFDEKEKRLMDMVLSFAHVAMAVEVQGKAEAKHAEYRQLMKITRAPADVVF
ncbi:MAG: hypothetical protein ACLQUZ_02500 [Rhizomicrobium sp.]